MASIQNEYPFAPTRAELGLGLSLQRQLVPRPRVEFIALPASNFVYVDYVIRLTNPDNGKSENFDIDMTMVNPMVTLNEAARIGLVYTPLLPTTEPVVLEPNVGMPKLKPGQVMGMFGPTGPTS